MALRDMRKYNLESLVLGNTQNGKTHTEDAYDYNQALLDEQFELLGNIFTIQEEVNRGSKIFTDIRASVGSVENIKSRTVVDDIKTLSFKKINHELFIGKRFEFEDNVWLATNVKTIKSLYNNCLVRRCNNVLRWFDEETNEIYEEPCIVSEKISATDDEQKQFFQTISGVINITMQYNDYSKKIKINQRFVLNGNVFEVKIPYNIVRQKTYDKDSVGNIILELELVSKNIAYDDLENNIAYKEDSIEEVVLNGSVVTPSIHDLSSFAPYNIGTYEVYNYIDNVKQVDEFEFDFFDALPTTYKVLNVTKNSFTIECLDYSKVPLVISYKNLSTLEIGEFSIALRGVL